MYIVAVENEEWYWLASFLSRVSAIHYWCDRCEKFESAYDRFAVFYVFPDGDVIVVKDRAKD